MCVKFINNETPESVMTNSLEFLMAETMCYKIIFRCMRSMVCLFYLCIKSPSGIIPFRSWKLHTWGDCVMVFQTDKSLSVRCHLLD